MADLSNTCDCGDEHCNACEMPHTDVCIDCGGDMHLGVTEHPLHSAGRVLLITNIPAIVCGQCGTAYFDPDTTATMWDQWKQFNRGFPNSYCAVIEYSGEPV